MTSSISKHHLIPVYFLMITFIGCIGFLSHKDQNGEQQEWRGSSSFLYPMPNQDYQSLLENVSYPVEALEAGIEGTAVVYAHIDSLGNMIESMIKDGFPGTGLGDSALAAVRRTRWRPAERYRTALSMWIVIPITFDLKDPDYHSPTRRGFMPINSLPVPIGGYEALETRINHNPVIKAAGIQGGILVQAFIDTSGRAVHAYMTVGPHPDFAFSLGEIVLEEIRKTRFIPAKQRDRPAGVWYSVKIKLSGNKK